MPRAAHDQITLPLPGHTSAARLLEESWTEALIALHRGQVAFSHYDNGMRPEAEWKMVLKNTNEEPRVVPKGGRRRKSGCFQPLRMTCPHSN
ncbi:hypothetical protein GCM10011345_32270 [Gemmobacter megaterium]|nr:hypothetical protein GCM10011345_32270 [Gemmobacter megaterium]